MRAAIRHEHYETTLGQYEQGRVLRVRVRVRVRQMWMKWMRVLALGLRLGLGLGLGLSHCNARQQSHIDRSTEMLPMKRR